MIDGERNISEDIVRVKLENPEDIRIQKVEEHEPEHMVFSTVIVSTAAPYNLYEQVLPEDPLRKDWSILAIDAPVVICNKSQVFDKANQVANVPFPQGAYLPQGSSITGTGTSQIFVVATTATPNRVSVWVNRRAG